MMLKVLSLLCLMALCHSYPSPADGMIDVEKALEDIFGPKVETTPSATSATHAMQVSEQEREPEEKRESEEKGQFEENDYEKCSKSDGKPRVCVPYYLCEYEGLGKITRPTTGDLSIRLAIDPSCTSAMDVCCEEKYVSKGNSRV